VRTVAVIVRLPARTGRLQRVDGPMWRRSELVAFGLMHVRCVDRCIRLGYDTTHDGRLCADSRSTGNIDE
jgi:hypothetical protein